MSTRRTLILLMVIFAFGLLMASFGEYRAQFNDPIPTLVLVIFINLLMMAIAWAIVSIRVRVNRKDKRQERVDAVLRQLSDEDIVTLKREIQYLQSHSDDDFRRFETMN